MKKYNSKYESRVKQNAVIIYLMASLLCAGMIYYIVNLKKSINFQKENIKKKELILNLTNDLIENINKAQSYSNLYIFSGNETHLNNFKISISKISNINDSIIQLPNDNINYETLDKIITFLKKKENIIKEINSQFSTYFLYKVLVL